MKYGYARVSTDDQKADLQIAALKNADCDYIFTDTATGASSKRPELTRCLESLRAGIASLSLTEAINTANAAGQLMGHLLGALAQFERVLIVERTQTGLKATEKRGVKLGRKPSLSDNQRKHARELLTKGESPAEGAKLLNVCHTTLYKPEELETLTASSMP
jgi:DNA invertase Pin-like site-specific DNA recombinase